MNDTDRLIASQYAAAMIGTRPGSKDDHFWLYYGNALKKLQELEAAANQASTDRTISTLEKLGKGA